MKTFLVGSSITALIGTALLLAQQPVKLPQPNSVQPNSAPPISPQAGSPQADQDDVSTFKLGVQAVQAPVTVLDRNGKVVSGLNALDFTLLDNGKQQQITEDLSEHPISLVVVIQANSAMEKILPQIRKAGTLFDSLVGGESGEMAVIAFDHRVQVLTNFTTDPDKVHAAFMGKDKVGNYTLRSGSSTSALNDATMAAVNLLKVRPPNRKRIMIIIAENQDKGSGMHVRDVLEAQEFANIVVYPLNVSHLMTSLTATPMPTRPDTIPPGGQYLPNGQVMTPTTDQQINNNGDWTPIFEDIFRAAKGLFVPVTYPLTIYSRYTGGREFPFYTQKGLEQAIDDIGQDLHNQYILTYSPNDKFEAGYHTIKVTVDKPDMRVTTREGYWMAGKPQ
jgi:VWFA-related protein